MLEPRHDDGEGGALELGARELGLGGMARIVSDQIAFLVRHLDPGR